jgi:hypothetical protein
VEDRERVPAGPPMEMTIPTRTGKTAVAVLLLPVLVGSLWLEVICGTSLVWDVLHPLSSGIGIPGDSVVDSLVAAIPLAMTLAGPAAVVTQVFRTRIQGRGTLDRIVSIETWSFLASVPMAFFAGLLIALITLDGML